MPYFEGDEGFKRLLEAEQSAIAAQRQRPPSEAWTGIALSGGGIRSASFCLGALQALAQDGWLKRIDYVSSVSGGGYIGAGLQWLLHTNPPANANDFPYGVTSGQKVNLAEGQTNLQYLRWHANYLLPGAGLDIFSAIFVVARTVLISLGVWLPLLILLFVLIQTVSTMPDVQCGMRYFAGKPPSWSIGFLEPSWLSYDARQCTSWRYNNHDYGQSNAPDASKNILAIFALALFGAWAAFLILGMLSFLVALVSVTRFPQTGGLKYSLKAVASVTLGVAIFCLDARIFGSFGDLTSLDVTSVAASILFICVGCAFMLPGSNLLGLLTLGDKYKSAEYWLRRSLERVGGFFVRWLLYLLAFGAIPIAHYWIVQVPKISISFSALSGVGSAVFGHLAQSRRVNLGTISEAVATVAACVFLYGLLVLAYHANAILYQATADTNSDLYVVKLAVGTAIFLAFFFGFFSNSNSTGLYRFYRDRLMELFMPSAESVREGRSRSSNVADRLAVSGLWPPTRCQPLALFPIINCNAILVNDPNEVIARRGGDNFAITPLHIGGSACGWETSREYEKKNSELTLATAIAASGAAANANSGYVGTGVTRNRAVSLVLMLLNIRLGVWVRRPSKTQSQNLLKATPFFPGLWYSLFKRGYRKDSSFLEITDGGHFENLGIYELVRRRIDFIIAFDGEADQASALPSLVSLTRRIEEDFGAVLGPLQGLDAMMPTMSTNTTKYPVEAKYAAQPCARAEITYPDAKKTVLIFVKASLIEAAPFTARGYSAQHGEYPNESTANQFYSPEQFDAYRELGRACTTQAIQKYLSDFEAILA